MAAPTSSYRPISDYALIGNTHAAALVGTNGSIDWCCLPHFDSGAVFCRLLDAERGGYLRVAPIGVHQGSRRYRDETAILETDFAAPDGRMRLTDFMHSQRIAQSRLGIDDAQCHRILRRVDGLSGCVELEIAFRPTFDFARQPTPLRLTRDGVHAVSPDGQALLRVLPPVRFDLHGEMAVAHVALREDERFWIVLSYADSQASDAALDMADTEALLDETDRYWREWDRLCTYEGPFRSQVKLSARVLKLLTFGPSGGLVAAPTTSLPEEIGGVRNWDYRFCWLRDAALVLRALMSVGYHEAAMDFFRWLEQVCDRDNGNVQIMYRLDGGRDLPERELLNLSGYRASSPVRIGNAASSQTQLDVYGHVLEAALACLEGMGTPIRAGLRRALRHLADQAAARWREPDQGFWEMRCGPRHFLSSKLLCWVALERAVRLAQATKLEGDVNRWCAERDAVRSAILEHGYNASDGVFTQVLGGRALDASALLIPLVGLLPATDERVRSTVTRIREHLTANGLVYRYVDADGVPGGEATFAICTFWLVSNLALQGQVDQACKLFEQVTSFGSDLGLLSEQIDPASGELLGNYPQGFTHLALIHAALTIARAQRRRSESQA